MTEQVIHEYGNDSACDNCGDEWAELDDEGLCPECAEMPPQVRWMTSKWDD